jgi:hypothetical protein
MVQHLLQEGGGRTTRICSSTNELSCKIQLCFRCSSSSCLATRLKIALRSPGVSLFRPLTFSFLANIKKYRRIPCLVFSLWTVSTWTVATFELRMVPPSIVLRLSRMSVATTLSVPTFTPWVKRKTPLPNRKSKLAM